MITTKMLRPFVHTSRLRTARFPVIRVQPASSTPPRPAASTSPTSSSTTPGMPGPQELHGIESRWEGMRPREQAEVWMKLRDRMKGNWNELSVMEKKAAYYLSFGPHGPRTLPPPGEWRQATLYTLAAIALSWLAFASRQLGARPAPKTMSPRWQEMSNEKMREQGTEAISGMGMEMSEGGLVGWEVGRKGVGAKEGLNRTVALREKVM